MYEEYTMFQKGHVPESLGKYKESISFTEKCFR